MMKKVKNISKLKTNYSGFTLIELLMVIAIIGILSSIVLVNLNGARVKARTAANMAALKSIKTALDGYYATHGTYPISPADEGYSYAGYCGSPNQGSTMIPELVAEWGPLPVDVRHSSACNEQFIYSSDGVNYKLIDHDSESMNVPSILIDPARPTRAWGWWTPAAKWW